MTLEEVNEELEKIEMHDMSTAIKGYLLCSFKVWLEDDNIDIFEIEVSDLDSLVNEIEDKCNDIVNEYRERFMKEIYKDQNVMER